MREIQCRKLGKRIGAVFLATALTFSGLVVSAPMEAEAAAKPKKLTVKTSNSLLGTSKTIYIGGPSAYKTTKLVVSVTPAKASKKVKYVSSKPKVAKVSSKGVVTAKKKGTTYITVTSTANKKLKKKIKITVKKYVYPKKITVSGASSLNGGRTLQLKTTFTPKSPTDKKVTYKSSNTKLATVTSSGTVKANTKDLTGTVKITVTARAKTAKKKTLKKTVSIKILPKIAVSSVKLSSTSRTLFISGTIKKPTATLTATVAPTTAYNKTVTWTSSNPDVATVKNGVVTANKMGVTNITAKSSNGRTATCKITVKRTSVSVHDPSIVKGTDGNYYIYGSHMAWAKTNSLMGWSTFTNNINKNSSNTNSIFATYWNNWAAYNSLGQKNKGEYDKNTGTYPTIALNGNEWAPDIIWNKDMKKWCMYMSINGPDYNSVIVMCTADSLTGDWKVAGPVVYSGFTNKSGVANHDYTLTDYKKVTGDTSLPSRYGNGKWNNRYGTNAIDPCVKYDEDGNLWMLYGSWFGGIHALKLDPKTGLRDYTEKYELKTDVSDPYFGIKVAGGNGVSGEAPYIINKDGYWYLFLSYGALNASGGYNMRVFRSENLTGPYVDKAGNAAIYKGTQSSTSGNTVGNIGIRLMSGYKWSCNDKGYLAQGHNSALVDSDGKMYLVFHTRTDDGTEGHYVKTHQIFMSEDGWLCVAPYEYNGETISSTGYAKSTLAGTYEYLVQNPAQKNGTCATSTYITLGADGSIGGLDAAGTWTVKDGTAYATFTIDGVVYKGVFAYGYDESVNKNKVMTFTAVGANNVCIWGSKTVSAVKNAKDAQNADAQAVSLPAAVTENFYLPTYGAYGSQITWTSKNENVIKVNGRAAEVNRRLTDTSTTLTATIKNGSYTTTKNFDITVKKYDVNIETTVDTNQITLPRTAGAAAVTWQSDQEAVINPTTGAVKTVIQDTKVRLTATLQLAGDTDVVKQFDVTVKGVEINLLPVCNTNSISLPTTTNKEGYTITDWKSSNPAVVTNTGAVTRPAAEKVVVTMTATVTNGIDTEDISMDVVILPITIESYIYNQDYSSTTAVKDVWTSANAQDSLSLETDEVHDKFVQFAPGQANSRGAYTTFGELTGVDSVYCMEFDVSLTAGNNQNTQFAVTNSDMVQSGANENVTAGYVLTLETTNSNVWTINGDAAKTVTLPKDWIHVSLIVNPQNSTAVLTITDGNTTLFNDTIETSGSGTLKGFNVRSGRYQGVTKVDNIRVY